MGIYNKLKTKEALLGLKETHPATHEECVRILNKYEYVNNMSINEAMELFWVYYPLDPFNYTRFSNLFLD